MPARRPRPAPADAALPSFKARAISIRRTCNSGSTPHVTVVMADSNSVKASTRPSIVIASTRGKPAGSSAGNAACSDTVSARPTTLPSTPTIAFSMRSWRARRPVPAPRAARIVISR